MTKDYEQNPVLWQAIPRFGSLKVYLYISWLTNYDHDLAYDSEYDRVYVYFLLCKIRVNTEIIIGGITNAL